MKKHFVIGVLVLSSALFLSACKTNTDTNVSTIPTENAGNEEVVETSATATVVISDESVSPASVTVKAGEAINWVNETDRIVQVGSDDHPSHKNNPELTGGEFVIALGAGESKSVSVGTKTGTWEWHDHLKTSLGGTVIVE